MTCHLRHDHPDNLTPYDSKHSKCVHCGQIIIGTFSNFINPSTTETTTTSSSSVTYPRRSSRWFSNDTNIIHNQQNTIYHPNGSVTHQRKITRKNPVSVDNGIVRQQRNTIYHPDGSVTQRRISNYGDDSALDLNLNNDNLNLDSEIIRNQRNTTYHPDGSVTQKRKVTKKPIFPVKTDLHQNLFNDEILRNQRNTTYHPNGSVTQQRKVTTKPKSNDYSTYSRMNCIYHPDGSVTQKVQEVVNRQEIPDSLKSTRVQQKIIDHDDGSVTHRKIITKELDYTSRHQIKNDDGSISYRKYSMNGGYEDIIVYLDGTITRRTVERKDKSSSGIAAFNLYAHF